MENEEIKIMKTENRQSIINVEDRISLGEKSSYYWEDEPLIEVRHRDYPGTYNLVDLCCGAGGISVGFEMTNRFKSILGVDIFTPALETYRHNHPNSSTILGDIRKISDEMFLTALNNSNVDVVTAGVPCQGFSLSNRNRAINDERNFLFLEVIRFVNLVDPKVVVIENVSGMRSYNGGGFVSEIEHALSRASSGYTVKSFMLNAANFGVPQKRNRLFFVAVKNGEETEHEGILNTLFPPQNEFGPDTPNRYNTIRDAISDLPRIASGESADNYDQDPDRNSSYQQLMRGGSTTLTNHVAPRHPQSTIDRINNTNPGEPMYERYRQRIRLDWDILSPTQLAGGIRPQFQFGHPELPRGLTVRERARIQSFPDWFEFLGGTVQGRVQTGNAVPPLLARAIANQVASLIDALEEVADNNRVELVNNL